MKLSEHLKLVQEELEAWEARLEINMKERGYICKEIDRCAARVRYLTAKPARRAAVQEAVN